MRKTLIILLRDFLCVANHKEMQTQSCMMQSLGEDQIEAICQKDYYEQKESNSFSFNLYESLEDFNKEAKQENGQQDSEEEKKNSEKEEANSPDSQKLPKSQTQWKPIQFLSHDHESLGPYSIFTPCFLPKYKLFFGSQYFFIFFKQLYTIYERLLKARDLINSKVEEDLLGKTEGLGKVEQYKNERFGIFIGGVISCFNGVFDANKYEDFSRVILGSRAYLLFSFDKLITSVSFPPFRFPLINLLDG